MPILIGGPGDEGGISVETPGQVDICNLALLMIGANTIDTLAENTKEATLCSNFWNYALDEALREFPWSFAEKHVELEYTAGYGVYATSDEKTITAITQADPPVLTITGHGWQTDYLIKIDDVEGMTELNDRVFQIARVDDNTINLPDIDATVYTAYTTGGTAIRYESDPDYADGYSYDLPFDYLCHARLDGHPEYEFEIVGWYDGTNQIKRLLTSVEDAVLRYTSSMSATDVYKFPTHFTRALAATLARMIHKPLAKKSAKTQNEVWTEYAFIMSQAKIVDAGESKVKEGNYKDPWLSAAGYE